MPVLIPAAVAARAHDRHQSEGDCRISLYSVASNGYPQIGWRTGEMRTGTTAHRAAWVHVNGQIPDGMTVDHVCKNRRCVNVDHLRLLSNYENARRTYGFDWPSGQCKNGHPDSERIYVGQANAKTVCRQCRKDWANRSNRKRRS